MIEARALSRLAGLEVRPVSVVLLDGVELGAGRKGGADLLLVLEAGDVSRAVKGFEGDLTASGGRRLLAGPRSARNLSRLRCLLPWLRPRPLGLRPAFGFGDRLGLATPGHVSALRQAGAGWSPIFAQQSIREMSRTRRSPQQVIDDATWGVFASGWRDGAGADADHLKTPADVEACAAAGFTFFTFDPGEAVQAAADGLEGGALRQALEALPWPALEDSAESLLARYRSDPTGAFAELGIEPDEEAVARAAVKYGGAVALVRALYRRLLEVAPDEHEVEVSVDETDAPTTPLQHAFVATELARLGVRWVSLAPRFVGRFEKGVDYIGDPDLFALDCAVHAAIARRLGPYKLSLHSGSDKVSIYPAFRRAAGDLAHVKTAGTSYLEALRTVSRLDPELFREVCAVAWQSFERDRASYHISARLAAAPAPGTMTDAELPRLLDDVHARQVLHVTFGTALEAVGDGLLRTLDGHREEYHADLERHFVHHLEALSAGRNVAAPQGEG